MHRSRVYQHSDGYRLEMVQSIHQRRNKGYTKGIRIRKSRRIEIHWTCSCTNEFNTTFSLCWVLGITLWFSERFSEGRVFCSSRVVSHAFISCFLGHPSILWSFNPQYRQRLLPIWLSQTSFGHISINSPLILTASMATESPWKDLSIGTSHVSRQSIMAEILGRSTGNHHGTVY